MWNDIETTADYLHFSVVAWAVVDLIRESGDNHVCIEVSGSWGSGKSSMVKMIGTELGYREDEAEKSDKLIQYHTVNHKGLITRFEMIIRNREVKVH